MPVTYDETGLAFDRDTLLTQQCPVERDVGVLDSYGGKDRAERAVVATLPCKFAWWHTASGRSTSREWADPETTVFFSGGTILLAPDANIRNGDHVGDITEVQADESVVVVVPGPFQVDSVQNWEDHTECQLVRPAAA